VRTDTDLIEHAACILDGEATAIRAGHNHDAQKPSWEGEADAKQAHDDMKETSIALYALAERLPKWRDCATDPPDSDTTVQIFDPKSSEPVWLGYLDGDVWRHVDATQASPTHWAEMPEGPAT
jgi:hypothetical protein